MPRVRFSRSARVAPIRMQWKEPRDNGLLAHFVQWMASGSGTFSPYIRRRTVVISAFNRTTSAVDAYLMDK